MKRSAVFFPDSADIFTASCNAIVILCLANAKECMKMLRDPKARVKVVFFSAKDRSITMTPHGKKKKRASLGEGAHPA